MSDPIKFPETQSLLIHILPLKAKTAILFDLSLIDPEKDPQDFLTALPTGRPS